jgi:protein TonB
VDAVAIGRGAALLASAAIHAGLIAAAGFVLGHSRPSDQRAAAGSQPVYVHLPSRPPADTSSRAQLPAAPPITPAVALGRGPAREASLPPLASMREGPAFAVAVHAASQASPSPTVEAVVASVAPLPDRTEPPPAAAAGADPAVSGTAAADYLVTPNPTYPPLAREQGLEGLVVLRVRVSRLGTPSEIRVATSSGHRLLDRAAEHAVARWSFRPARRGEEAIEAWMDVPIRFRLGNV